MVEYLLIVGLSPPESHFSSRTGEAKRMSEGNIDSASTESH